MRKIDNKLIADDGMTITNGEAFGKIVWLALSDDGSGWNEITDAEADVLRHNLEEVEAADYEAALENIMTDLNVE